MTHFRCALALSAMLALAGGGVSLSYAFAETDTSQASEEEGWEVLFDGTSTSALRDFRSDAFPEEGWSIEEDGSLYSQHGAEDIVTRKQYSDFDLRLEWKLSKGANSGVLYRVAQRGHHPHDTGPEYQIIDDPRVHRTSTGSLYALMKPSTKAKLRSAGQWNTTRIVFKDNHVRHYLNGELALAYVWGSDDIKQRLERSKFKNWEGYMQEEAGHIGFQSHGNELWLRNIRIKDLSEPADR